jgi:hypothetical protein
MIPLQDDREVERADGLRRGLHPGQAGAQSAPDLVTGHDLQAALGASLLLAGGLLYLLLAKK